MMSRSFQINMYSLRIEWRFHINTPEFSSRTPSGRKERGIFSFVKNFEPLASNNT